jgi:hypothetical protein
MAAFQKNGSAVITWPGSPETRLPRACPKASTVAPPQMLGSAWARNAVLACPQTHVFGLVRKVVVHVLVGQSLCTRKGFRSPIPVFRSIAETQFSPGGAVLGASIATLLNDPPLLVMTRSSSVVPKKMSTAAFGVNPRPETKNSLVGGPLVLERLIDGDALARPQISPHTRNRYEIAFCIRGLNMSSSLVPSREELGHA